MHKKKKIALLIPYFGKLPNYASLFFNSAKRNKSIDFFFITDTEVPSDYISDNIKIIKSSFKELRLLVKTRLNAILPHPYKLCDYRPCYGVIFSDYINNYEYWGHCDIDIILGDVDKFLDSINYRYFDRCFPHGHFVLYKNTKIINELFTAPHPRDLPKLLDFNFVKKTSLACHYDELGINYLCRNRGVRFFEEEFVFDIDTRFVEYVPTDEIDYKRRHLISYENGKVFSYILSEEQVYKKEYMYVHFQKRRLNIAPALNDDYYFTHKGVFSAKISIGAEFIKKLLGANYPTWNTELNPPLTPSKFQVIINFLKIHFNVIIKDIPVRFLMAFQTPFISYLGTKWESAHRNHSKSYES